MRVTGEPHAIAALAEHWYLRRGLIRWAPFEAEFAVDPVGMAHMPRQLLHSGTAIIVVEPSGLKQMVANLATQWVAHHSSVDPNKNP